MVQVSPAFDSIEEVVVPSGVFGLYVKIIGTDLRRLLVVYLDSKNKKKITGCGGVVVVVGNRSSSSNDGGGKIVRTARAVIYIAVGLGDGGYRGRLTFSFAGK